MLGIGNFFFGSRLIVRIEVSNNLSCCLLLSLLCLSNNKLFNLIGGRHNNEACTFNKLLDILLLNELLNLLISNNLAISLNLNAGISRIADSLLPAADSFNRAGILGNTSGIRTNNLFFTNGFFLINSSVNNRSGIYGIYVYRSCISIGTLYAINSVAICSCLGNCASRLGGLHNTADEASCNGSGSNLNFFGLLVDDLSRVCFLNNALGERTVCRRNVYGLTLYSNAVRAGNDDTLLSKKGNRDADHGLLRLSRLSGSVRISLGDLVSCCYILCFGSC